MASRNSLAEPAIIFALFVLGLAMRIVAMDRAAVEHFDEGVYASDLWYPGMFGQSYPGREFYAPPLLGAAMSWLDFLPGLHWVAPFLPSALLGAATVLMMWALARAWFGRTAGLFAATIVSLSDFHIIFSRMALTDVPALFLMIASVYVGTKAIADGSRRMMVAAGFVCGLSWWTKYTGWLPLAIVISGSALWWMWTGRRRMTLSSLLMLLALMVICAFATFAPWWWKLQDVGGYSAVASNHAGYVEGLAAWKSNLAAQLTTQFWLDGFPGSLSVGLGLLLAGGHRWMQARCSTWNSHSDGVDDARPVDPEDVSGGSFGDGQDGGAKLVDAGATVAALALTMRVFPPPAVLARFVVAAIALSAIALTVWTPLLLTCIAIGGMAGVFLWPVLPRMYGRARTRDLSATSEGGVPLSAGDLACAATIDPQLAACTVLTWFVGLLLVTPLYHPYPRLFLPLLASIWVGAAGGLSWWVESNLSVARRPAGSTLNQGNLNTGISWMIYGMIAVALMGSILINYASFTSAIWQDLESIRQAALQIADRCYRDAVGLPASGRDLLPSGTVIRANGSTTSPQQFPDSGAADSGALESGTVASGETGSEETASTPREVDSSESTSAADGDSEVLSTESVRAVSLEDLRRQKMVIYAYGEPSLLYHLQDLGIVVSPVAHLDLKVSAADTDAPPQFLIVGPYAKRTNGFWDQWLAAQQHFELIAEIPFYPSEIVLLNLFDAGWLRNHPESAEQIFEVYRIR